MSLIAELRRRDVFRVGIAYLAAVWLVLQVADLVLPNIGAPAWILTALIISCAVGFPLTLVLAWFYEWTAEGIRLDTDKNAKATLKLGGRQLDFAIIGLLVLAVGALLVDDIAPLSNAEPSIAVLPFVNDSAAEENAVFFANGMHDEVMGRLAKIDGLKLIARQSVMQYRNSPKPVTEIGRELGVATLLEASVLIAGEHVRISASLVDAKSSAPIWSEVYDRDYSAQNVFAIHREMSTAIVNALRLELLPERIAQIDATPTFVTSALNYYMRGLEFMNSTLDNDLATREAVKQYEMAVEADGSFAAGWAALSEAHMVMYQSPRRDRSAERLVMAETALRNAEALAPGAPEVHLARGRYYYGMDEFARALDEYRIAEQGMPGSEVVFRRQALAYKALDQLESAMAALRRVSELDPLNVRALRQEAAYAFMLRRYADADRVLARVLEILPRDVTRVYANTVYDRARIPLARSGDFAAARLMIATVPEERWTPHLRWLAWTAEIYAGNYEHALDILDGITTEVIDVGAYDYMPVAWLRGVTHELMGAGELAESEYRRVRDLISPKLDANREDHRLYISLGGALVGLGQSHEALRLARRAIDLYPADREVRHWVRYHLITRVLAPAGPSDLLFEELDNYLAEPGEWTVEALALDPRFESVRVHPRFSGLLEKYRRR